MHSCLRKRSLERRMLSAQGFSIWKANWPIANHLLKTFGLTLEMTQAATSRNCWHPGCKTSYRASVDQWPGLVEAKHVHKGKRSSKTCGWDMPGFIRPKPATNGHNKSPASLCISDPADFWGEGTNMICWKISFLESEQNPFVAFVNLNQAYFLPEAVGFAWTKWKTWLGHGRLQFFFASGIQGIQGIWVYFESTSKCSWDSTDRRQLGEIGHNMTLWKTWADLISTCNYQKSQLQCSRKKETLQTVNTIIRLRVLVLGHSSKGNGRFAPHVIPSHGQISVWRLWTSPAKRPMPVFQFWPRYFWPTALSLQRLHISIPRGNINSSSERAMALAHKRWPLGRARLPKGSRLHSVNWTPLSWRSNTSTSLL